MNTSFQEFYYRRFRNQVAHAISIGACLVLGATGIFLGAVAGVKSAALFAEAPSLIQAFWVISMTLFGFLTGCSAAYGMGPIWIRIGFSARAFRRRVILPSTIGGKIDVFMIDDEKYPSFGKNVVVAGFKGGKGMFRPAIFLSETVSQRCTAHEIDCIIAHELGHLASSHLKKRVVSSLVIFSSGAVFTALVILGIHWSGYAQIATHVGTFAGIVPALLTWVHNRRLLCSYEKEADMRAIYEFGATAEGLLSALRTLSTLNSGFSSSLLRERIEILESLSIQTRGTTALDPALPIAA